MPIRRIAVTGGPGAGKTTLWRELANAHADRVLAVPEVATLLLAHVFPPPAADSGDERCALQRAIFEVQRNLEQVYESRLLPGQVLLCDRGVPDGGGYWPEGHEAFFAAMQTDWERELLRYDAVLFMESAAVGGLSIAQGNSVRREDAAGAVALDARLRAVWQRHPNFLHVPHAREFEEKLAHGKRALEVWLARS